MPLIIKAPKPVVEPPSQYEDGLPDALECTVVCMSTFPQANGITRIAAQVQYDGNLTALRTACPVGKRVVLNTREGHQPRRAVALVDRVDVDLNNPDLFRIVAKVDTLDLLLPPKPRIKG